MGNCFRSRATIGKQDPTSVEMDQKASFPTIQQSQYTNSISARIFGGNKSNTLTAPPDPPDVDNTISGATTARRNSYASTTKTILTDQDVFSREAIRVSHQFWVDNLMILSFERRQEIGVTLYAQMFRKMPECRKIFLRGDIEKTSEKFFQMIGWLIMELAAGNTEVWSKVKVLGKAHKQYGITYEHYLPMLQAFHVTFQEQFPKIYTLRIKFCIENLFMNAAKIMTGKDFVTLFADRVQDLETLEFLDSLDACLAHQTGREYFERFLEQIFCAEYVTFLRAFDEFKQIGNTQQRYEKAEEIYLCNFDMNAEAPIELNTSEQREHVNILKGELAKYRNSLNDTESEEENAELCENLLDALYADVKHIIEENSWDKFHAGIYSIKQATRIKSY